MLQLQMSPISINFTSNSTVLSGAEERGVDGPSLDRSYFSRLQPISFLIFQSVFESSRLACSAHTVCDDARRRRGSSRFEVSNAAEEVVFTANAVCVL